VNSITLGIEIANRNDGEQYPDEQYRRVAEIVAHYCRQGLVVDDVVSHAAIAEDRRTDPYGWDWVRFRALVRQQLQPAITSGVSTYDRRSSAPVKIAAMTNPKPALCSRTIWLNGLTVLAAGSVIVGETLDLAFSIGLTVPEQITMWALFGVGVVNIILRFHTTCPIGSGENIERARPKATIRVTGQSTAYREGGAAVRQR
jgi:hypothetical protein